MTKPILTKAGLAQLLLDLKGQDKLLETHDPVVIKNESVKSFAAFMKYFLKHHFSLKNSGFHDELIQTLSGDSANKRVVRIAPRGHGKTTLCAMAFSLWVLAAKKSRHILIIGSMQQLADLKLNDIIGELETNTYLLSIFPGLKPKKDSKNQYVKYTDSHIVFEDGSDIMAKGMGAAVRGIKPRRDLIIIDDPEKDTDVDSPVTREKNKRYFDNVVRFLGGPGQSLDILAIDTLKHFDSLIQYIMEKPGWDSKKYSAVVDEPTKQVLWPSVYCYDVDSMEDDEKKNWSKRGQKGYEGIREPFYGRHLDENSDVKIIGIAEDRPESFAQEFLSQPIEISSMPLRKELWITYPYSDEHTKELPYRIGALDSSMGKTGSDYQAIAIMGVDEENNYYLLDASLNRVDLVGSIENEETLAAFCVEYIRRYGLSIFVIEDNGAQGLFINTLRRLLLKSKINCNIKGFHSSKNKIERITNELGLIIQRGSFKIRVDYEQKYPDFMRQFEHFPKGDHDDAPDVTNMAIMGIQRMRK